MEVCTKKRKKERIAMKLKDRTDLIVHNIGRGERIITVIIIIIIIILLLLKT